MKRPLLCRLGWHTSTYSDGAFFNSAQRCNRCDQWVDKAAGERVDNERQMWSAAGRPATEVTS